MILPQTTSNVVIVGAGLAGLFAALQLAPRPVTVIAAAPLGRGASSAWAQGGIAAAVGEGDTAEVHAADTIAVGAGLVDATIARGVADDAAGRVNDLLSYGVPFDRDPEQRLTLSREAAHSAKRVVRVGGDRAGRAIMQAIISTVERTPSIQVLDSLTVAGVRKSDDHTMTVEALRADDPAAVINIDAVSAVVLATGGIGALYARSTNPLYANGDGIAIAARMGAAIADAEFVQFHPTAIDVDSEPVPLATEALRGEGAVLINRDGRRFMPDYHGDAEMGPRDVVARAVFEEIRSDRGALLDCTEAIGQELPQRFPTVHQQCIDAGIDARRQPIPVTPAEHYHMGGVKTDSSGRTGVDGLWAIGEVASTGLHGANRLASNSLLEGVVFAARAAADVAANVALGEGRVRRSKTTHLPDIGARESARRLIRATMGGNVGVVRDDAGLRTALETLGHIERAAEGDAVIENAALAARFVAEAALRRKESRGAHFRSDYPHTEDAFGSRRAMTLAGLNLRSSAAARSALSEILGSGGSGES